MTRPDDDLLHDLSERELDALLSSAPHVDDDGFSARVVAALPPPRRARGRGVILGVAAVAGVGLSLTTPGVRALAVEAGQALLAPDALFPAALALAALVMVGSIWAAVIA